MLGAGVLGRPRGLVWGGRREEGSGWGQFFFFFPLLAIFLRAQAWEPCLHPLPLQPEGAAVFVIMPGKEKRSFVEL